MAVLLTFFLHGEYGFGSIRGCCYSSMWVWNSGARVYCIASGKLNASRTSLRESDVRYAMFSVNHTKCVSVI